MKGIEPIEEIKDLAAGFKVEKMIKLNVPGLDAQRHLVQLIHN